MKKLFALFSAVLTLIFSIFSFAASIPKANVINGKWTLSDSSVYSTVSNESSNGVISKYLLKYCNYSGDFEFNLETYALRSSQNDSGAFIGTVKNGVYNGVFVKLTADGLKIIEVQNDKKTEINPLNASLGILFSDDNGQNFFNEMKIKKDGSKLSVTVNGNELIYECPLEALFESGNIYIGCNVDANVSVSFKNVSFVPVLPITDSSLPLEPDSSSSIPDSDASLNDSGVGGGYNYPESDLIPTELKYVAFGSLFVIFVLFVVCVITGIASKIKNKK